MGAASFLATPSVSPRALNTAFTQMHWQNIQLPIETQKRKAVPSALGQARPGCYDRIAEMLTSRGKRLLFAGFCSWGAADACCENKRSHKALTTNPCEQTILSVKPHVSIQCCCMVWCAVNNKHAYTQTKIRILTGVGDGQKIQPSLLLKKRQRDIRGLLSEMKQIQSETFFLFLLRNQSLRCLPVKHILLSISLWRDKSVSCILHQFYVNICTYTSTKRNRSKLTLLFRSIHSKK